MKRGAAKFEVFSILADITLVNLKFLRDILDLIPQHAIVLVVQGNVLKQDHQFGEIHIVKGRIF